MTNAQYLAFVEDGGYTEKWKVCWTEEGWEWKEREARNGPAQVGGEFDVSNHPVVAISWYEAVAFCAWLTQRLQAIGDLATDEEIRLPSGIEWEKAARGTDGRTYPWGEEITPEYANYSDTGLGVTSPVGCFPRGVSPYDCEEQSGNVWEWCIDPVGSSGLFRVVRGGGWGSDAVDCRSADRGYWHPDFRTGVIGFRLLRAGL